MRRWWPGTSLYRMVSVSIIWRERSAFAPAWGRTSSRRAKIAIRGWARRGTRACRRASRQFPPRSDRAGGRSGPEIERDRRDGSGARELSERVQEGALLGETPRPILGEPLHPREDRARVQMRLGDDVGLQSSRQPLVVPVGG